ncbi:hypothetical protein CAMRE0001_0578 [Campylobacter rectus RM3267]|uniref:Uncharacterized protein n=1 Tax=Campylobacter rectus RM3267 TaxID=553218 RepID=B9D5Q4_CAMRE|nr:hypothetical protein CAMRE0001_0578 [Campylobacter rectus RM3267]
MRASRPRRSFSLVKFGSKTHRLNKFDAEFKITFAINLTAKI